MKWMRRVLGIALAVVVTVFVLQIVASETGEVVRITTVDRAGEHYETSVWIVDVDGQQWIRSGSPTSRWFSRLQETPSVELERGGQRGEYTIAVDPSQVAKINALMREKYGWADAYIGLFVPRSRAVAIRLDPRPDAT